MTAGYLWHPKWSITSQAGRSNSILSSEKVVWDICWLYFLITPADFYLSLNVSWTILLVSYTELPLSLALSLSFMHILNKINFHPPIDLPDTTLPLLLLSPLSKRTALYNQLNRSAVCHRNDLPWGLLVTQLRSLSLLCTMRQSRPAWEDSLPFTWTSWWLLWMSSLQENLQVCVCVRITVFQWMQIATHYLYTFFFWAAFPQSNNSEIYLAEVSLNIQLLIYSFEVLLSTRN